MYRAPRPRPFQSHALPVGTVGAHAKKHPASFQGTLGFFISQGFTMESHGFPHHKSVGTLGFQGWVSCGRFLVAELPLYREGAGGRGVGTSVDVC